MSYGIQIFSSSSETVFDSRDTHLAVLDYGTAVLNISNPSQPRTFNISFSKPVEQRPYIFLEEKPYRYGEWRREWERPFPTLPEIPVDYTRFFSYRKGRVLKSGSFYTGFTIEYFVLIGWLRYVASPGWFGSTSPWRLRWVALYEI